MATSSIVTALQTINASITGVRTAPSRYPGVLRSADLPMALPYPMAAEHSPMATRRAQERRTWAVSVYVQPLAQGTGVDEGFDNTVILLDRFVTEYQKLANQSYTSNWEELQLVSDTGVRADLVLHGAGETPYWGFQLQLLIITHYAVTG